MEVEVEVVVEEEVPLEGEEKRDGEVVEEEVVVKAKAEQEVEVVEELEVEVM